jgi:uncharacterized OsmC-like protein
MDEPEPLGDGVGPNAARVAAAAIGNCLSASLVFCLERARIDVADVRTRITGSVVRNERGRLRLGQVKVEIDPAVGDVPPEKIKRCLDIFEDFCIVTASLRDGLDVEVTVKAPRGEREELVEART